MITKLKIFNFKAHYNTELDIGPLTVLAGVNSSGKSSVLHALLLLRQSFRKGRLDTGLDLNKPLCVIGNGYDALSRDVKDDAISFAVEDDSGEKCTWKFDLTGKWDDTFIPLIQKVSLPPNIQQSSLFTNDFQYLSASRWANRRLYPMDTYAVETEKQISLEYGQGELVAHFLHHYGNHRDFDVRLDNVLHSSCPSKKLLEQTIAWEGEVSPRVTMTLEKITGNTIKVEYGYTKGGDSPAIKGLMVENVGFGLSYSLPVITALLSASPGSLLIIENPEAHIHPQGQSKIAELIALAAQGGAQVIVETHSDHILNGILVACKKFENGERGIDRNLVKIYHFTRDEDKHCANAEPITILEDGKIDKQPKGFFDQTENDLSYLLGF
ncbi:MAG: DUF3696 domain-containing protein [Chitinispirillia bacterium]|nr:DUF3696 domain-containing protein [Chitinispirillia bacterium]